MDHFERNGLRFDVIDSGPEEASAVVLLHGFPQQPSSWDAVAGRLQAEGLRTLVPTQRGYTPAARPTRRRDYATAETAADVVALLDAAGHRPGAHRRPRLGRRAGVGGRGLAPRPGHLADRAVHPPSRGDDEVVPDQHLRG